MKRKDKSRKRDGSPTPKKEAARPRPAKKVARDARSAPPRGERTPTNKKRKARRTGRDRGPAGVRVESRHIERPKPELAPNSPAALAQSALEERLAVDAVGLGDTDIDSEEAFELGIGSRVVPPTTQYGEAFESSQPEPAERRSGDVEAQIRALEARLDGLIRQRDFSDAAAEVEAEGPAPSSERRPAPLAKSSSAPPARVEPALPPAEDFISRKWGRSALRSRAEEFDDFGLDPGFEQSVKPAVDFLYKTYFRTSVEGIDNVPAEGRCIIVANHSGALPLDGPMLRTALRIEHPKKRDLRWLAEDFMYYLPFAGVFMNRVGAVRACPENAERLLEKESLVAVFPEGVHGIKKLFRERYHLQRFGRGGYIRLCLRMRAPIVPCAIIGAEESSPLLYRLEGLTELLGLPYFPITPTFPLLGPAGLLPAPTKWKMRFGEPIHLDSYGPEAADDHVLVGRLSERVRSSIQAMLDSGLRERRSVWFG
ncbi:MAG: 1-acyl-sn-glycerol-3-phosphate acyltransferase [Pseudomonadota bacterium]